VANNRPMPDRNEKSCASRNSLGILYSPPCKRRGHTDNRNEFNRQAGRDETAEIALNFRPLLTDRRSQAEGEQQFGDVPVAVNSPQAPDLDRRPQQPAQLRHRAGAFCVPIESQRRLYFFYLTRFPSANRYPFAGKRSGTKLMPMT